SWAFLMPAVARASTSLMSEAFFAFTWSSSVRRSLIGSSRFFTHVLRAIGLMRPQKPSFASGIGCVAVAGGVEVGVCCAAAGGLWELSGCCVCWAIAGIAIAEAKARTATWLGNRSSFKLVFHFLTPDIAVAAI